MFGSLPGISGVHLLGGAASALETDDERSFDIPIYGPTGELLEPGNFDSAPSEPDPMEALRRANSELESLKSSETTTKHELNQALRRVQTLETQLQKTLELVPRQEETKQDSTPEYDWGSWNRRSGETPKPQATPQQKTPEEGSDMAIDPSQFDQLYQDRRTKEIMAEQEVRQKLQQAADKFVGDSRLSPYYNDALVEFNRLQQLMPGSTVDQVLGALNTTVNDWISRGWKPRNPYDPKRAQGGIPTGGQQMGAAGIPMVGDNRFRPDEQGSAVGFYSDEQRTQDANSDRRARQQDLEARKTYGMAPDAKTYEEYFTRKEASSPGRK